MYKDFIINICSDKNRYSRDLVLVAKISEELSSRIGDSEIYISEFVIAKILGYINHLQGHPEVTKEFLLSLPEIINNPKEILKKENRPREIYLICGDPAHRIVLELSRNKNKTEINTIHRIRSSTLAKLEEKCLRL